MAEKSVRVVSGDRSVSVDLTFDSKMLRVQFKNPALRYRGGAQPVALIFETSITDAQFDPVWASFLAVADRASADPDEVVRFQWLGERGLTALTAQSRRMIEVVRWLLSSQETTNHTYALTDACKTYLAHAVAMATGIPIDAAAAYIREAEEDRGLVRYLTAARDRVPADRRALSDPAVRFARRLGWYAVVRAVKPGLVVETGVDKGLGGVLLCAALLRNRDEGRQGRYLGTDINPDAGYLLGGPYADVGRIAFGDSLATLAQIPSPVGVFINDSDHMPEYEAKEYAAIESKLAPGAVILSDNAGSTTALADFARATERKFLYWREQPLDHWYPGGGIGFAFDG